MADHLADTFAPFTALALAAAAAPGCSRGAERENVETRPPGVEVALHPASR